MDDTALTETLKELGLSTYAAETFLGLQRVGTATASDIAAVTDVPRSQVYGAADELAQLGLVNVQSANPKEFRAVAPDTAGELLQSRIARQTTEMVNQLEAIREADARPGQEESNSIWRVQGLQNTNQKAIDLLESADRRVQYYVTAAAFLPSTAVDALKATAVDDCTVSVFAPADTTVAERQPELTTETIGVEYIDPPTAFADNCTRLLVVDDSAVLVGVTTPRAPHEELCFWSASERIAPPLAVAFRAVLRQ
ncbi:TrmB family transcriptional regulator [Halobacterium sp. CBA1126]|uniref:TrmB family transcriptional regulator n=1 Tax=Halobacterium TaxID=2239 RepID=UPI0012F83DF9|nr:helix-turn-helix domain-containing protein [Halobacterium sp. CBA1126]MUV59475.1 hypothetical protein [Halobacterium sp. CBA1126]